jgi:hypothetical protein
MEGIGNISNHSVIGKIGSEATLFSIEKCIEVEKEEMVPRNLTTKERENLIVGLNLHAQLATVL